MTRHEQISRAFARSNSVSKNPWPERNDLADAKWIITHSGIPWLRLDLHIPADLIFKEIQQATHLLTDHRDDYGENRGWKSFCLHGKSLHQTQHCDDRRPFRWIPQAQMFLPNTVNFFKSWSIDSYHRIRVMALEPGGYVSLHRDLRQDSAQTILGPINIAITQPDNCHFIIKDWGIIPFKTGDAYMPNVTNWHTVINNSNQTRYHIIVHCGEWPESFNHLIERSYQMMTKPCDAHDDSF